MNTTFQSLGHAKPANAGREHRTSDRTEAVIPGRIIWRDNRGTPRFSSVVTRDVSEGGAFVQCLSGPPIPMHRLVFLQLDRATRGSERLPEALKQGKILSAVYRVGPVSKETGLPDGYALRLLVEPAAQCASVRSSELEDRSLALPA